MSVRVNSDTPDNSFGLARALGMIGAPGERRTKVARAREAQKAANDARPRDDQRMSEGRKTERQSDVGSAGRQDGQELWPLPGIAPMTRVRTSFGDVHAAALRKGDEVLTRSGKFKKIVWLNRICLDEHVLNLKPDSNPIVLAAGALGASAPAAEIMISPRQIICADDASGLSSAREASMLISRPGVRRLRETGLSYTMFHVGEPAEVYCEGLYLSFPLEA